MGHPVMNEDMLTRVNSKYLSERGILMRVSTKHGFVFFALSPLLRTPSAAATTSYRGDVCLCQDDYLGGFFFTLK